MSMAQLQPKLVLFFHSCKHACYVVLFFSPSGSLFLSCLLVQCSCLDVSLVSCTAWVVVVVVPSDVVLLVLRGAAPQKMSQKVEKVKIQMAEILP